MLHLDTASRGDITAAVHTWLCGGGDESSAPLGTRIIEGSREAFLGHPIFLIAEVVALAFGLDDAGLPEGPREWAFVNGPAICDVVEGAGTRIHVDYMPDGEEDPVQLQYMLTSSIVDAVEHETADPHTSGTPALALAVTEVLLRLGEVQPAHEEVPA